MALTSTPTDYANLCTGRLASKISPTTATGFIVTADTFKTPAGTSAATWPTGPQIWKISRKTRTTSEVEFVGVETASQSGSTVTTGTVNRYLPANGSSLTSQGDGLTFPAGSVVELVWHAFSAEKVPYKDVANTFSANQTISSTNELRFADSATALWDDGTDLNFKSSAQATRTLSQLASLSGSNDKAKVSSNDTTEGYLNGKMVAGAGITLTENNDAGNETLSVIAANTVATGHTGLSTVTSGGLLVGAGTSNMTVIGPGSSGQVPVSNGTTIAMGSPSGTVKVAGSQVTNAAYTTDTFSNSSAENAFTTTISPGANALVAAGDKLVIEAFGSCTHYTGSPSLTWKIKWGSATIGTGSSTGDNTNNTNRIWRLTCIVTADTVGASGVLQAWTELSTDFSGSMVHAHQAYMDKDDTDNSITGFNTTTSQALSITTQFSGAHVNHRVSLIHFSCHRIINTAA